MRISVENRKRVGWHYTRLSRASVRDSAHFTPVDPTKKPSSAPELRKLGFLPEYMDDYNRRFARAPRNAHDAHRPLQDEENPDEIFSWQEDRNLSGNLTVHFKRATYSIEPGPETAALAGKRVRVHEWADGPVEIRAGGKVLPYSLFDDHPRITQATIVENKRLRAALAVIQAAQIERDRMRLDSKKLTVREKTRIRAGWAEAAPELDLTRAAKADISTLPESGHFYFALTSCRCDSVKENGA